jgi:hypothetical protein
MEIFLPSKFDRDTLMPFFLQLDNSREEEKVVINFSNLNYSLPTATLIAGTKIREWVEYRASKKLNSFADGISDKNTGHTYLMHVGFFKYIKMPIGKDMGEARGSINYLPITKIKIEPFDVAVNDIKAWHESIQDEASRLARILTKSEFGSEEFKTYSYCLREIIRNVFEHSGALECYIFGQRWINGQAEIAVVDSGIGIKSSLGSAYVINTDEDALNFALRPGISRTNNLSPDENVYGNSGFGLYVLSNIAASFGWFIFGSNRSRVVGYNNTARDYQEFSFPGTFFGMRLKTSPKSFRGVLLDVISVGESESNSSGISRKASGLSRHST